MHASVLARLEKKITRILEEPKNFKFLDLLWPYILRLQYLRNAFSSASFIDFSMNLARTASETSNCIKS